MDIHITVACADVSEEVLTAKDIDGRLVVEKYPS